MYKASQTAGERYLLTIQSDTKQQHAVPVWLTNVLNAYQEVFQELEGLPPTRTRDHTIV